MEKAKSFAISKQAVWEAYNKVKANRGAAGIDEVSLEEFERDLKNNLYKLWNRMSSGSYFPPAVKAVPIPKKNGGVRILGVPTVADRIAQMVVKDAFEPLVEPHFHKDSYGYRPGKSAHDALEITRKRCWRYDWVLEFDIRGLFDNIDHELLMRAVRKHTDIRWVILYIERWLKAPFQTAEGELVNRTKGTPQGGVVSTVYRCRPHAPTDLQPIHPREHQIQNNQIIGFREGLIETGITIVGQSHFISRIFQMELDKMGYVFIILNYKDSARHAFLLPEHSCCCPYTQAYHKLNTKPAVTKILSFRDNFVTIDVSQFIIILLMSIPSPEEAQKIR